MYKNYWEEVAPHNEEQIFDVLKHDNRKLVSGWIDRVAGSNKTAMDIGCSVGKWLPKLSTSFKKVIAADISSTYIELARENNSELKNIEYLRADISATRKPLPAVDVALCINAVLTPSFKKRAAFFNAISNIVKPGGYLILTVPALESALLSEFMLNTWDFRDGKNVTLAGAQPGNALKGVVELDSIPTKHYLREELANILQWQKFKVLDMQKIEYNWNSEFTNPPAWMKAPYPWDWLVVGKKE